MCRCIAVYDNICMINICVYYYKLVISYYIRIYTYSYTSWFHYDRHLCLPVLNEKPFDEEVRVIFVGSYMFTVWCIYSMSTLLNYAHIRSVHVHFDA